MVATKVVWDMTTLEKWSGRKPSIEHLRTFGCIAWAHIPYDKQKRLAAKGQVLLSPFCG
jgi:hypothetical protein